MSLYVPYVTLRPSILLYVTLCNFINLFWIQFTGALFLTNYRIIFKGTPIDPFAAEHTVIRYFPISSLTREKRFTLNEYLSEIEQQLKEGIQIRSNTFQLIRAAFDDEVSYVPKFYWVIERELKKFLYPFCFARPWYTLGLLPCPPYLSTKISECRFSMQFPLYYPIINV